MKHLLEQKMILATLIHATFLVAIISYAHAYTPTTVELYDESLDKSSDVPASLPVSVPPSPDDLEGLSEIHSGPAPSPTPSALKVCKDLVTNHGYKVYSVNKQATHKVKKQ